MIWLRGTRLTLGWLGFLGSMTLLVVVGFTYSLQPDHFAAFTLMPVWVWVGCGIAAALTAIHLLRMRLLWALAAAWVVMVLAFADEARVLANVGNEAPKPGTALPHRDKPVIRVITANCHTRPMPELADWKPDVVLLQDVWPFQAHRIARELYGREAQIRVHETNAIATHWNITDAHSIPRERLHMATIEMPDGRTFKVVNVHLVSAATDLSLWRRDVWTGHRVNRAIRINELNRTMALLKSSTAFPEAPAILGGDFNAPPGDPVYRLLGQQFIDVHPAVGTRWGNTYHRRFPILRIDRIHATRQFTPVRSGTHVARASDHRFVVADFVLDD